MRPLVVLDRWRHRVGGEAYPTCMAADCIAESAWVHEYQLENRPRARWYGCEMHGKSSQKEAQKKGGGR